jgi:hypothetical protein
MLCLHKCTCVQGACNQVLWLSIMIICSSVISKASRITSLTRKYLCLVFPDTEHLNAWVHYNPCTCVSGFRDNKTSKHGLFIPTVITKFHSSLINTGEYLCICYFNFLVYKNTHKSP